MPKVEPKDRSVVLTRLVGTGWIFEEYRRLARYVEVLEEGVKDAMSYHQMLDRLEDYRALNMQTPGASPSKSALTDLLEQIHYHGRLEAPKEGGSDGAS